MNDKKTFRYFVNIVTISTMIISTEEAPLGVLGASAGDCLETKTNKKSLENCLSTANHQHKTRVVRSQGALTTYRVQQFINRVKDGIHDNDEKREFDKNINMQNSLENMMRNKDLQSLRDVASDGSQSKQVQEIATEWANALENCLQGPYPKQCGKRKAIEHSYHRDVTANWKPTESAWISF